MKPAPLTASRLSRALVVLAAAITLATTVAGPISVAFVGSVICVASALPGPTFVRRLVLALPVMTGLSAAAFTTLALCSIESDVRWVMLGAALTCAVAAVLRAPGIDRIADKVDAWSAVAALAAVALVARSAFWWHPAEILARLAKHTDGIRHIALAAAVERHGGYVTFSPDPHRLPGLQHYPQGGAGMMAIVLRAFAGRDPDVASTTVLGFWALVATLALMTWLFTTVAVTVARQSSAFDERAYAFAVIAVIAVTTCAIGPHFIVYEPGYFTQDVALIAVLATMCVMLDGTKGLREAATISVLLVALAQTWYLLLPVAGVMLAWWWRSRRPTRVAWIVVVAAIPFILYPLVTGPSPTRQLVVIGGTPEPSRLVIAALLVGGGAAVAVLRRHRALGGGQDLLLVALYACIALTLLVGAVEIVDASAKSAYYAIKLFVLALVLAAMGTAVTLPTAWRSSDPRDRVLAVVMSLSIVGMTAGGMPYFLNKTSTPTARNVLEARLYLQQEPRATGSSALFVVYDGCDERDRFLTHALATLGNEFAPSRFADMTRFMNSTGSPPRGLARLSTDPGVRSLRVITAQPCAPGDVDQLRKLPNVTVIDRAASASG